MAKKAEPIRGFQWPSQVSANPVVAWNLWSGWLCLYNRQVLGGVRSRDYEVREERLISVGSGEFDVSAVCNNCSRNWKN